VNEFNKIIEVADIDEKMDILYHEFFIKRALNMIINYQTNRIASEEDMKKQFDVSINFNISPITTERNAKTCIYHTHYMGIYIKKPEIGFTLNDIFNDGFFGWDGEYSPTEWEIVKYALPKWIVLKNLSGFDSWNINEEYDIFEEKKTLTLSFTSSLQKLIEMYEEEKQKVL